MKAGLHSMDEVGYQVLLQRRQVRNHVAVEGYKLYQNLAQQYIALPVRSDSDPALNCIWGPPDEKRRRILDKAQRSQTWGAFATLIMFLRTSGRG